MEQKIDNNSDALQLLGLIDERIDKAMNQYSKEYLKKKIAVVDEYDEETLITYVKLPTDENENTYMFYNKSGSNLQQGDYVSIQYTTNFALGDLLAKTGEPRVKNISTTVIPYVSKAIQSVESTELSEIVSVPLNLDFTVDGVQSDTVVNANQIVNVTTAGTLSTTYDVDSGVIDFAPEQALSVGKNVVPHIIPMSLLTGEHNLKIKQTFNGFGTMSLGDLQGVISGQISGIDIEIPPNYNCIFKFSVTGGETFTFPKVSNNTVVGKIYWGDGSSDDYSNLSITHVYAESGDYNIVIVAPIALLSNAAFYNRSDLLEVTLSDNVVGIPFYTNHGVFEGCSNLTSVKFGKNLHDIGMRSFRESKLSGKIIIPETVTSIGSSAFRYNSYLTSCEVNCPNWVDSQTAAPYLFEHCTSLVTAVWNTPHSIDNHVFNDCPALTTVIIKGGCGAIQQSAFYGATSLSEITIPPSVKLISYYAFNGCTSLNSVTIARDCVLNGSPFPTNCTINYYD